MLRLSWVIVKHCLHVRQLHRLHFSPVTSHDVGGASTPLGLNEIQATVAEQEAFKLHHQNGRTCTRCCFFAYKKQRGSIKQQIVSLFFFQLCRKKHSCDYYTDYD